MNTATSQFDGHTPGPWSAVGPHINAVRHNQPIRVGSTHPAVSGGAISGDTCDGAEEANARLIAAAPELLRQRDALLAALRGIMPEAVGWGNSLSHDDYADAARKAAKVLESIENGA